MHRRVQRRYMSRDFYRTRTQQLDEALESQQQQQLGSDRCVRSGKGIHPFIALRSSARPSLSLSLLFLYSHLSLFPSSSPPTTRCLSILRLYIRWCIYSVLLFLLLNKWLLHQRIVVARAPEMKSPMEKEAY